MMPAPTPAERRHIALHLAHRWFAFFEAQGGDLNAHLAICHPRMRLTGHQGGQLFATDRASLKQWFTAEPNALSSHHIVHNTYVGLNSGDGILRMLVAYQALMPSGMVGSIVSYETRIEFGPGGARFVALDKTPILPNERPAFETSWAQNRALALALVHADLGGLKGYRTPVREALGATPGKIGAYVTVAEGSQAYHALVIATGEAAGVPIALRLSIADDKHAPLPVLAGGEKLDAVAAQPEAVPMASAVAGLS